MKNKYYLLHTFLFTIAICINCSIHHSTEVDHFIDYHPTDKYLRFTYTKEDSIEAKKFAIWLTGTLEPGSFWVSELLYNLKYLRHVYADTFPVVNDRFFPPWVVGQIAVKFDSSTAALINQDRYDGFDLLPVKLRPDRIREYPDEWGWAVFTFDECYHPRRLAEIYSALPGVLMCTPNGWVFGGWAGYPLYPRLVRGELTYLFDFPGWECYYFRNYNGYLFYIGSRRYFSEPEPDWWPEAKKNSDVFRTWDGF